MPSPQSRAVIFIFLGLVLVSAFLDALYDVRGKVLGKHSLLRRGAQLGAAEKTHDGKTIMATKTDTEFLFPVWSTNSVHVSSPPRDTFANSRPDVARTERKPIATVGRSDEVNQIIAIGSFSMDQLTVGCNQFATFVLAGVAWHRSVVIPQIQGNHYIGLAGSQDMEKDSKYSKSNNSLPRKMDDYFNLEHISNHLEKHHLKLVPQAEALELCKGQWSILYLIPSTEAKHSIYGFLSESRTESFRNSWQSTMKKLKGSGDPRLAIETDCDWITEGMPKDVRQLAPFSRVICAAIPSRFTWQWKLSKAAKLVSDVSSRCLLISHWFGPHRHGFRRPKKPPAVWFSAARRIQDTAQRAVGRSSLSKGFTVLHVRSEYIFNRCRPSDNPPFYCQRRNVSFQTYFKQCADLVLRTIASHPRNQSVLMAFDLRSEGMKLKRKQALLQPIQTMQYMLNRLKEQFTKVITLEDFVARHIRGTANRDIVSNNGMRALLDAEILTQASPFVAVGGGHFQGRMLEQVKDNGTLIECHNIM
eukprot:scpid45052/ scgid25887/ 